jgi:hypothetical protein
MSWLYVPLDVNYAEDDKIIEAGPMAELLYVRSLAFAKRDRRDGRISDGQIRDSVAPRIPKHRALADRLVDVGLWQRNGSGIYISAWLKRNEAAAAIADKKSTAGALGNHIKWGHEEPDGKPPTADCSVCVAKGLA